MSKLSTARLEKVEKISRARTGMHSHSVYGIVDKLVDGEQHVIRRWKGTIGNMVETDEEPNIFLCEALEPVLLKHKRVKVLYGGRAGTKSIFAMDAVVGEVSSNGSGVFCLREHMNSLSQSIFRGIENRIEELDFSGFTSVESKWRINHANGGIISFGGLQNVRDMKSLFKYKYFLLEEADNTSQFALDVLGPTLRGVDGSEMILLFNPKASNDPVSQEFIIPYEAEIERHGFYEDDYHLIINVNYQTNPWFNTDKSLVSEIKKDQNKLDKKLMSKARYNHIWHGHFLDSIENGIIDPDWIDAAIDAHEKLGFEAQGARVSACDIADVGEDNSTICHRHGVVVEECRIIDAINANVGFDEQCTDAIRYGSDSFIWDCSGMGALLREQAGKHFQGKKIDIHEYKGAETPFAPEAFCAASEFLDYSEARINKEVFYNRRAQDYIDLAYRFWRTYDAVVNGTYHDPGELISLSSKINDLKKLRSELGRLPLKANSQSKILLFSKEEGRRGILQTDGQKIKIPSPDLADPLSMVFSRAYWIIDKKENTYIPRIIKPMTTNFRRR